MNLLVIGGTQFVGRAIVEEALARGHSLTLFHRGQTNSGLFQNHPNVEHRLGDRKSDLSALASGNWDAVIDCVGYEPGPVQKSCEALRGRVGMYAFISTISVYGDATGVIDENSAVQAMPEGGDLEQFTNETYGALKVLCEEEIEKVYGDKSLIIRAGLQAGPFDHTDRFSNWVERIARRDVVVVPSGAPMPWQIIDSRDTARFTLGCIEKGVGGIFNTTGPVIPMPDALECVRKVVNPKCRFVEVTPEWLAEKEVKSWSDIALWLPEKDRGGFPLAVSIAKALTAGLACRAIEETAMDIRDRVLTLPEDRPRRAGLDHEREDALLAALANKTNA